MSPLPTFKDENDKYAFEKYKYHSSIDMKIISLGCLIGTFNDNISLFLKLEF